jgi:dihydrolipoamide dehydrogenase
VSGAASVVPSRTQLLVLGGGPGGYTAAFRAADLGLEVVLVERHPTLGGVCLNVGCIPSKALLHVAKVLSDAERLSAQGISFGPPEIDFDALRAWKSGVVAKLTGGLAAMARQRGVTVITGEGELSSAHTLEVGASAIEFEHAIIATGSRAIELPAIPVEDRRVMGSTDALALQDVPGRLLVVGGGIVGLELATVYDALGARVTVVEMADQLIAGCDEDLVAPLHNRIAARYEAIHVSTVVEAVQACEEGLEVRFAAANAETGETSAADPPVSSIFDKILVAVGRRPNSDRVGLAEAGVALEHRGFVSVDAQLRSSQPHIYAIGDVAGAPMLAHKATHEAKVAAEVIAGEDVELDLRGIPSVAYTDPEIAWVGLTEAEAARTDTPHRVVRIPWAASGRAVASDATGGLTKLIVDPEGNRILGAGASGTNACELIAEAVLALELGTDTADLTLTSHAHPTLAETIALAAEMAEGTVTDLPNRRG